jgi:hypothetical protein
VSAEGTCAVCGRSILAGERTRTYMSPRGGLRLVCDLCRERAERLGWIDPAAPGATVGRLAAPDPVESPANRLERAVARFNASQAARTVAGLMRTLGPPFVSIGAAAGSPSEVRITVAWDLCWYQWGVDLGDELRPVFQLDKGSEVEQLDGSARQWNAGAEEGGRLALGAARSARDGEPVG